MGRGPTNENTNMYFQARKKAATYNERLWSREGAAELLGISVSTLADYELGNTKVVPVDKVVLIGKKRIIGLYFLTYSDRNAPSAHIVTTAPYKSIFRNVLCTWFGISKL